MRFVYERIKKLVFAFFTLSFVLPLTAQARDSYYDISREERQRRIEELSHVPLNREVRERPIHSGDRCELSYLWIPVYNRVLAKWETIRVLFKIPRGESGVPAVLVLPTLASSTALEKRASSSLCHQGIAALVPLFKVTPDLEAVTDFQYFDKFTAQVMFRFRTILDYMTQNPRIDSKRLGVLGFSLGGVLGADLALVDDRVQAVFLAAAAGNFAGVVATSASPRVTEIREKLMDLEGIDDVSEFERRLRQEIRYDALFFTPDATTEKFFLMRVTNDDVVSTEYQMEFWQDLGEPQFVEFSRGHSPSIVQLVFQRFSIIGGFFNQIF